MTFLLKLYLAFYVLSVGADLLLMADRAKQQPEPVIGLFWTFEDTQHPKDVGIITPCSPSNACEQPEETSW